MLAVSCLDGTLNFVQRYIQTCVNQGQNLTLQVPSLSLNFQNNYMEGSEDLNTLKDKDHG